MPPRDRRDADATRTPAFPDPWSAHRLHPTRLRACPAHGPRRAAHSRSNAGHAHVTADPALAVVSVAEGRIAEPVVGDVDALRALETLGAGNVGVVETEQRPPGDLDDLGTRIGGDLEASVEVVGGCRWAWRHRRILLSAGAPARYHPPVSLTDDVTSELKLD